MKQAKIQIPLNSLDKIIEGLSLLGLFLLFFIPYYYYDQLADTVPAHFGLDGKPDAWGGKNNIWVLPAVGLFLYLVFTIISKFPHAYNYPVKITAQNATAQYTFSLKLLRRLKLLCISFMSYFMFSEIQVALGKASRLGVFGLVLFVVGILCLVGYYFIQSRKINN